MPETKTPDTPAISQPKPKGFGLLAKDIAGVAQSVKRAATAGREKLQSMAENKEFNTELFLSDMLYAGILAGTSAHDILQKISDGSITNPDAVQEKKERDYPKVEMVTYGDPKVFAKFRGDEAIQEGEELTVVNLGGAQGGGVTGPIAVEMADPSPDTPRTADGKTPMQRAKTTVGVSAGELIGMWNMAGNGRDGLNIIDNENTKNIRPPQAPREIANHIAKMLMGKQAPIISAGAFAEWATSTRPINLEAIRNSPTDVWVVATNVDTGLAEYVNVTQGIITAKKIDQRGNPADAWESIHFDNTDKNILAVMTAGVCLPAMDEQPYITIELDQTEEADETTEFKKITKKYADGGISDFVPLKFAQAQGTHTLILSNYPMDEKALLSERMLFYAIAKIAEKQNVYPPAFITACLQFIDKRTQSMEYVLKMLREQKDNPDTKHKITVIAPREAYIQPLEQDSTYLRYIMDQTGAWAKDFFTPRKALVQAA